MVDNVLVELVIAGDKRDETRVGHTLGPLECRHLCPRIAVQWHGVEAPDVDTKFECTGTPDARALVGVQCRFDDPAAVVAQSRTICCNTTCEFAIAPLGEGVAADGCIAFYGLSGACKRHCLVVPLDEIGEQTHDFPVMGATLTGSHRGVSLVVFRWLSEQPLGRSSLTGILIDEGERVGWLTGNRRRVLSGITDCRRATGELWVSIEPLTESRESAKHKPDVTAEDQTILMDFVDDHGVKRLEKGPPEILSVTKQATVEHIWRRQHK